MSARSAREYQFLFWNPYLLRSILWLPFRRESGPQFRRRRHKRRLREYWAPRKIHNEVELANVTDIIDRLAIANDLTDDQEDYLETLSVLVADYEDEHHPIDVSGVTPLETLKFLLSEAGLTGSDLGRILGQRQIGSAILRGERQLSKVHMAKLAKFFKVQPSLFLAEEE